MKKTKKTRLEIFYIVIRFISLILFISNIVFAVLTKDDSHRSRLIFNTVQSGLMFIFTFFPIYIEKVGNVDIPNFMEIIFVVFCLCHFILGEISEFYVYVPHWDSILHTISGSMFAILAFSLIGLLNDSKKVSLSPIFVALFALCFSMAVGGVWEIIEFGVDCIFGTNMQRFDNSVTRDPLMGQNALMDTMKDLIVNAIGAIFFSIFGYFGITSKKKENYEKQTFEGRAYFSAPEIDGKVYFYAAVLVWRFRK